MFEKKRNGSSIVFQSSAFVLIACAAIFAGCNESASTVDEGPTAVVQKTVAPESLKALPVEENHVTVPQAQGVSVTVTTPSNQKEWYRSQPKFSRAVPEKTMALSQFTRTLEKTELELTVSIARNFYGSDGAHLSLYQGGKSIAETSVDAEKGALATAKIRFTTPAMSDDDRKLGFAKLTYDLFLDAKSGKRSHIPFSFLIYDESSPSLVIAKGGKECLVYHEPERASGCYINPNRSTQEVVFNDSVVRHHEVDVTFSGSLSIEWSVVTAQLGVDYTIANGTDVSRGSEIHFTSCIECASVIYRQVVETLKQGDVYQVMADGSLTWVGSTVLQTSAVAYEFESTGSESRDYNCNIPSKLPVGSTPSCEQN